MKLGHVSRRQFLGTSAGLLLGHEARATDAPGNLQAALQPRHAQIAITLDLEMSRNFPRWEDTHWDYEKGNLDEATKRYAVEVARRVKARGGTVHFFLVARVLEQENLDWLHEIIAAGHPVGNHTYDHVNVKATKPAEVQARFQRAPWLMEDKTPAEVIRENIRMATAAMKERLGIAPSGFRTPGGFRDGLADRADVQQMLLDLGFKWASSKYPSHLIGKPAEDVTSPIFTSIVKAQAEAQPFTYPSGLIELPISPISDVGAFRTGRWKLETFLQATGQSVEWAIAHSAVFDFLCHPSCIGVMDPEFRTVDLICDLVQKAGDRAKLVNLETVAQSARSQ